MQRTKKNLCSVVAIFSLNWPCRTVYDRRAQFSVRSQTRQTFLVYSAVFESARFISTNLRVCKRVFSAHPVAHNFMTTITEPRSTSQDFQTTQRLKRKGNLTATPSEATTSFLSPNQFTFLLERESDLEENGAPLPNNSRPTRIPPIVIYSYLINHSSTLKQVNEKLTAPVEVKSKTVRLLL